MDIFDVFLKIIALFGLSGPVAQKELAAECQEWRETAVLTSPDKMKVMYAKMHTGPWLKLVLPLVYFFAAKKLKGVLEEEEPEFE